MSESSLNLARVLFARVLEEVAASEALDQVDGGRQALENLRVVTLRLIVERINVLGESGGNHSQRHLMAEKLAEEFFKKAEAARARAIASQRAGTSWRPAAH